MLSAEDIRNITFTKSMGGYKTAEVDVFIDQCADTVAALVNEKAELSKKLEVLADKLVEYRNEEDSIRTALLSAQRLGDTVVRESNHKAALILEDANIKAEKIVETARQNIQDEERELERIQREVANFKARMLSIYREHLALIDVLPEPEAEKEEAEAEQSAAPETVPAGEAAPAEEAAAPQVAAEPAPAEEPAAPPVFAAKIPEIEEETEPVAAAAAARPASRFANLKFGEDYDISKDTDEDPGFFKKKK